jgi:integrase
LEKSHGFCHFFHASRHIRPFAAPAQIGEIRFHDLRHSYGSLKIDQGEDIVYVSRQMGHANVSITADVYAHEIRKRRPEAAAKTDAAIFGV